MVPSTKFGVTITVVVIMVLWSKRNLMVLAPSFTVLKANITHRVYCWWSWVFVKLLCTWLCVGLASCPGCTLLLTEYLLEGGTSSHWPYKIKNQENIKNGRTCLLLKPTHNEITNCLKYNLYSKKLLPLDGLIRVCFHDSF